MKSVKNIKDKISVYKPDFSNCISTVEHNLKITGVSAAVRFHYLRFDGNKTPMVNALAETLYTYIIDYCISAKNRSENLTPQQAAKLTKEARSLFRHPEISDTSPDKTGEAGETLLYFLMEAVLQAPQIVSKMELKTNHKDEVKGSDGIHARWNTEFEMVDFYFGESKLYKKVSDALTSALKSVNDFHEIKMYEHEFNMVTKHFKYADEAVKQEISKLFINGNPGPNVRINHACLIGYDYHGYAKYSMEDHHKLTEEFEKELLKNGEKLVALLQEKFNAFKKKHLIFEVFFLPFPSVVDFRNAFNEALN